MDHSQGPQKKAPDDDGWSHVTRKPRKHAYPPTDPNLQILLVKEPGLTIEEVETTFRQKSLAWRQSTCAKELYRCLDRLAPENGWAITKAVCLGYGSFSRHGWDSRQRTTAQLAMFLGVVAYLKKQTGSKIDMYAQETSFGDLDRPFLASKGFTVLEHSSRHEACGPAVEHFGQYTFVCELFLDHTLDTIRSITGMHNPLFISTARPRLDLERPFNDIKTESASVKPRTTLKEAFDQEYQMYDFPMFEEDPNVLNGLMVCGIAPQEDD
jgi:hypothetical protein